MKFSLSDGKTVLSVIVSRKRMFLTVTIGLMAASLMINVSVLSMLTGTLPSSFLLNGGSFALQADLGDPVDQFVDRVFPLYNYPLAIVMFPREFVITNELGLKENIITSQLLFLTIHYFSDFVPFALLISSYIVLSRYYFAGLHAGSEKVRRSSKNGTLVGLASTMTPSIGSGATTALTAIAGGICCGAFAVESSIYVLGFAIGSAGLIFFSRLFLLVMAAFLILGIFRTARKINAYCVVPLKQLSGSV